MDVPLWPALLIELCLLLLTLFTTLMDAVADGLSESRLERMKEEGDARAEALLARLSECRATVCVRIASLGTSHTTTRVLPAGSRSNRCRTAHAARNVFPPPVGTLMHTFGTPARSSQ